MRGFFAALRMTSKNEQLQLQKQILFEDDNKKGNCKSKDKNKGNGYGYG